MAGERDRIPSDLSRIDIAEPQPHQHPGPASSAACSAARGQRGPQRYEPPPPEHPVCSTHGPRPGADLAQRARSSAGSAPERASRRRSTPPRFTGGVAGQPDGIPGDLIRMKCAAALTDQHASLREADEHSCSLPAAAAAVHASRRSVTRRGRLAASTLKSSGWRAARHAELSGPRSAVRSWQLSRLGRQALGQLRPSIQAQSPAAVGRDQ
jgi:hypothetical protein